MNILRQTLKSPSGRGLFTHEELATLADWHEAKNQLAPNAFDALDAPVRDLIQQTSNKLTTLKNSVTSRAPESHIQALNLEQARHDALMDPLWNKDPARVLKSLQTFKGGLFNAEELKLLADREQVRPTYEDGQKQTRQVETYPDVAPGERFLEVEGSKTGDRRLLGTKGTWLTIDDWGDQVFSFSNGRAVKQTAAERTVYDNTSGYVSTYDRQGKFLETKEMEPSDWTFSREHYREPLPNEVGDITKFSMDFWKRRTKAEFVPGSDGPVTFDDGVGNRMAFDGNSSLTYRSDNGKEKQYTISTADFNELIQFRDYVHDPLRNFRLDGPYSR